MPAAASGKKYPTVDARCEACEVLGGPEKPCLSVGELRVYRRDFGRPCPRQELMTGNTDLATVTSFAISEDLRGLVPRLWACTYPGLDLEDQRILMIRMANALQDRSVAQARRDAIKRQMAKKA